MLTEADRGEFRRRVEGWEDLAQRPLRVLYESTRHLAQTEADQGILIKMLKRYTQRLNDHRASLEGEGKDTSRADLVLQKASRAFGQDYYMSELIGGRFQIAESITPVNTYYLIDHQAKDDLLYRPGGPDKDYLRLDSLEAARLTVQHLLDHPENKGKMVMAGKKTTAAAPAAPKKERGPSAASRFKELILAGKLSDDEIFASVQKEFSLADDKRSYVGWYRKWLIKNGDLPADAVAAKASPKAQAAAPGTSLKAAAKKVVAQAKTEARGRKPGRDKAA